MYWEHHLHSAVLFIVCHILHAEHNVSNYRHMWIYFYSQSVVSNEGMVYK